MEHNPELIVIYSRDGGYPPVQPLQNGISVTSVQDAAEMLLKKYVTHVVCLRQDGRWETVSSVGMAKKFFHG